MATWFAEAVRVELAELAKKGGEQRCELHSGQRLSAERLPYAVYRFSLADGTLVPEDANGTIEVEGCQFKASVIAQETNRVDVQIDDASKLSAFVHRATLCVDDLGLLRKLAEILEAVASGTEPVSRLATAIFHPKSDGVFKLSLPGMPALDRVTGEQRAVIEQACASEITFVWGPPGTGKTYLIAHLIAALVEHGERVLMTSHTHAAVDQSIYETVKDDPNSSGPLADSDLLREGKIVRIGRVPPDSKVPESVRLDNIVQRKAEGIRSEISELQRKVEPLSTKRAHLKAQLAEWDRLSELRQQLIEANRRIGEAAVLTKRRLAEHAQAQDRVDKYRGQVEQADRAWFFRARKVEQARGALAAAERACATASTAIEEASAFGRNAEQSAESLRVQMKAQTDTCAQFPSVETLREQLVTIDADLDRLEQRLAELTAQFDALEKEVITTARVVAATLTKCYVGNDLDGQSFDTLIVDEISMALPPLLFVAARRTFRRVILVGDFKQLPPIVRADTPVTDQRLGTDAFLLAGMADRDLKPTNHPALTRLKTQRRMLPQIAEAARHISYEPKNLVDDKSVLGRSAPLWLGFLPCSPLVVVDTADLHCWSGRQAGSLSRFNLYSAQIAVELAARAATAISRPNDAHTRPIGIVTPYAAQGRLLLRLVKALELDDWVKVGTVHTFQGGEAELIIFDSVLDEPYWTARLCNPNQVREVKRDLNVALTRAKSKFLLVGSSEWLNRRAKPTSGLGQLWHYMIDHADLVSAHELVEVGFTTRVADAGTYCIPTIGGRPVLETLDENTFFDRFAADLCDAKESVFGLVAFFGEYRWPRVEPLLRAAIERGIEVTLITPPPAEAQNKSYVEKVIRTLRQLGARVIASTGLHGKDVVVDSHILYTGSLNWASHRGRREMMHRVESPEYAKRVLEYLQARHIRDAATQANQTRTCPQCGGATQVVNQAQTMRPWDKQPMKLGCACYQTTGCKYLVNIDERPPFLEPPLCSTDQRTKYRRVKRGRGETWECPKHPKECERFKVVAGDPGGPHAPDGKPEDGQAELSLFYP